MRSLLHTMCALALWAGCLALMGCPTTTLGSAGAEAKAQASRSLGRPYTTTPASDNAEAAVLYGPDEHTEGTTETAKLQGLGQLPSPPGR